MSRAAAQSLLLALVVLSPCSCVERALEAPGGGNPFAPVDLAGADLRGVDLAGVKPGVDLASPGDVDLGVAQVGVPCGSNFLLCTGDQACCISSFGNAGSAQCTTGPDPMCNAALLRCDGPEDCMGGRSCVLRFGGDGAKVFARCRMDFDPSDIILCHSDADCVQGGACGQFQPVPGLPPLQFCN